MMRLEVLQVFTILVLFGFCQAQGSNEGNTLLVYERMLLCDARFKDKTISWIQSYPKMITDIVTMCAKKEYPNSGGDLVKVTEEVCQTMAPNRFTPCALTEVDKIHETLPPDVVSQRAVARARGLDLLRQVAKVIESDSNKMVSQAHKVIKNSQNQKSNPGKSGQPETGDGEKSDVDIVLVQ